MSASSAESVVIKKYANRRLYNTSTSTYVTLENLAQMVKEGIEFNVYDAKTNEDLTRAVLTQIIVEEEGKSGQNLLPVSFMRNLISFYGDNMQWLVPKYLEQSMQSLTKNQEQIRSYFQTTFGTMFPFGSTLEQMGKQNMALFERTMKMFTPFAPGSSSDTASMGKSSAQDAMSSTARSASDMASGSTSAMRSTMQSMQSGMENTMRSAASSVSKTASKAMSESAKTTAASMDSAAAAAKSATDALQEAAEEAAFTPSASLHAMKKVTPMPTPETSRAAQGVSGEDVQNKIAALQRQLSDLAKNKA